MSRVKAASSPASPPLTSGSVGVMVEKRRHRSDRCRLIPVSAVYTRGERLHKIRDRPSFFLAMPYCNTNCTNTFLAELSKQYPKDLILLVCDGAGWHRSKNLVCPENIQLLSIPPYTPEMNPIEQIWKQIRSMGFRNEVFHSLADVVDRLCETICCLTNEMVKSITGRDWIIQCFR